MKANVILIVLVTLAAVFGLRSWNAHLIAKGDAQGSQRVQGAWNQANQEREATEALQRAAKEAAERQAEQAKQKNAERIAYEQAQREQTQRAALAAAIDRNRSLHTTIAQLNADAAARLSSSGPQSCTAADIDGATAARNALGQCSSRYTAVAGVADQLAGQVAGLQDYVRNVTGGADGH